MSKLAVGLILLEIASWMGCASGPEADGSRAGAAAASAQDATLLLEQGWQEYGFQSFVRAQRLFAATGEVSGVTSGQRWEALLGAAMIVHHQMPGRDPASAEPLYAELLEQTEESDRQALVLARLGDCHAEVRPPDLEAARDRYRGALALSTPKSLLAQDAALRLVSTYMRKPSAPEFARGLEVAAEMESGMEGTVLAGALYGLQAELALFVGDNQRFARALRRQYEAGIHNVQIKERVLFQLARLHEVELGDYAAAESFYRRLAAEVPTSQKAHFASLRADELARGQLDSDFAPPLTESLP
jgi:hypothetical protein